MSKTNEDALQIIMSEGIGYAVQDYASADSFEDPLTRELWRQAKGSLDTLITWLERDTGTLLQDWEI